MTHCTQCQRTELRSEVGEWDYSQCGVQIRLRGVEVATCAACGARSVAIPNIEGLHATVAGLIVRAATAMTGGEAKFLRKYLGHSTDDFARIMGVTEDAVRRWEASRPGAVEDRLIRLLVVQHAPRDGYPVDTLAQIGADPVTDQQFTVKAVRSRKRRGDRRNVRPSWQPQPRSATL